MRRGLSPLVATLLLIAFTVMGGIIVYEYYNRTSESIIASGEQLMTSFTKTQMNSTHLIVQLDIVNGHRSDIKVKSLKAVVKGTSADVGMLAGEKEPAVPVGKKYSFVLLVPSGANAIVISYEIEGRHLNKVVPLG